MISMTSVELPPLIPRERLADACREAAAEHGVQPATVEKDYYLTRLIAALSGEPQDGVLLKGGALLSKVDLGFKRMSEDVDLVLPGVPSPHKRENAQRMNALRRDFLGVAGPVGVEVPMRHGEREDRDRHVIWEARYDSEFGPQRIIVEATIRPVLRPPRRVRLEQLLVTEPAFEAHCWALDELEARAEKVRAAFTRRAIRDYYDLDQLDKAGKDLASPDFVAVIDDKLAERGAAPIARQPAAFGMTESDRKALGRAAHAELPSVLRIDDAPFDFEATLRRFDELWSRLR
jgi:predicted nucleotidyltransferase component of viral defense system